jgi:hypothetical protein
MQSVLYDTPPMLSIEPSNCLLSFDENRQQIIILKNNSSQDIIYKTMTNVYRNSTAKPSRGIIPANGEQHITISLIKEEAIIRKVRYNILYRFNNPSIPLNEMWRDGQFYTIKLKEDDLNEIKQNEINKENNTNEISKENNTTNIIQNIKLEEIDSSDVKIIKKFK